MLEMITSNIVSEGSADLPRQREKSEDSYWHTADGANMASTCRSHGADDFRTFMEGVLQEARGEARGECLCRSPLRLT